MSQKQNVVELYEAGKEYDEIEKETGAKRSYIRTIVSKHKKDSNEEGVGSEGKVSEDEQGESQGGIDNGEMHFNNDIEDENNLAGDQMGDQKTGAQHHKAWVEARAYECACGCTLNRKSKFCPNCGVTLDWSGF